MNSKIKYIGTKTVIDKETGKEIQLDVIQKEFDLMDSKRWRRVVMVDLMDAVEKIGNKKIKVLEFIVDNMDENNFIKYSQREIIKIMGVSEHTVNQTFKTLKECGLIKQVRYGYSLNCSVISAYGNKRKNTALMIKYEQEAYTVDKNFDIDNKIKTLKNQLQRLENAKAKQEKKQNSSNPSLCADGTCDKYEA